MTSQTFKPHATIASTLQDEKVIFEHIENGCNEAILTVKNLLHAPEACCMVEALIILACCTKDPSLISAEGIKTFRYLRTPGSYKSSLYQVINSVWNAFRVAYNSMQRIQLSLSGMPDLLNDLMEATNNLEEQDSQDIINNSLAAIEKSANKCVHSARDADDEFEVTLELLRAAISTLGHSEHRAEAAEIDLQEQDVDLKDMADYLREGIQQLSKVQIAWRNIVTFFYYIKNFVDYSLMHHIEGITIYVEQISENQQTFFSTSKCRILLREVTKACAVANVLMQSARQCDIVSNFTEIKDGVEETIETYTQSLTDNVYDAMKAQGFEITRDMEGKKTTRTTR
uniref:Uncharacterized protein n=1 Tax=Panagrolaimus davidi TaxID=227884 RepID=A0A914RAV6_9BILA